MKDIESIKSSIRKFLRFAKNVVDTFADRKMGFQAVALSYWTTMAIIPFLAFVFAVTGGLGLSGLLSEQIYELFIDRPEFARILIERVESILDVARSGVFGVITFLSFFWFVLWLIFSVERVINNNWGITVQKSRGMSKRFITYASIIILCPFIITIFTILPILYTNLFKLMGLDLSNKGFFATLIAWTIFYVISSFTLSALYKFVPATRVRYGNALLSAALTSIVFCVFQWLYLKTQFFVAKWSLVFGAVAALPLFLIWMNWSWQIILYGAQFCWGLHQGVKPIEALENTFPGCEDEENGKAF
ncbi:MAG: YihY/virulence factor BrkB family protein [Bacteroidales bacterium]|nr:YihY/virulence factor BrkB family protein [Bacteroidales bacterium]